MLDDPYEKMLRNYLRGEFQVLNAHIPLKPKSLAELLKEEYPSITAKDGNVYLFKKKELTYLAGLLSVEEQKTLLLPILIEVVAGEDEVAVIAKGQIEAKVISVVLGMPITARGNRIRLYKPQLAGLRKALKTATQYIFSPKLPEETKLVS